MISVIVKSNPPLSYEIGPGSADALSGPIFINPSVYFTIEPPPAPIVSTSTAGRDIGWPDIFRLFNISPLKFLNEETSVDVPPMSMEIMFGSFK